MLYLVGCKVMVANIASGVVSDDKAAFLATEVDALSAAHRLAQSWRSSAAAIDAERRVPVEEVRLLERSGLLGVTVPRAHGGPGLSTETLIKVFLILGASDIALAQIPQNHYDFVDTLLVAPEETQTFFYGEVLGGARFGNAIAEPGRRSRRDLATTIVETENGYVLNGKKYFSTGALTAKWVPVLARDKDDKIVTAYVRNGAAGLKVHEDWDAFGQRATFSGTTTIETVEVPRAHVVDRSVGDPAILGAQFAGNQLIQAAIEVGGAEDALNRGARDLGRRGHGVSDAEWSRLGELGVRLRVARALVLKAARFVDNALEASAPDKELALAALIAVDEAKSIAYELGPEATNEVLYFAGPFAGSEYAAEEANADRHWRNARTHSMHDPLRWRKYYISDYYLNDRLFSDIAATLRLKEFA